MHAVVTKPLDWFSIRLARWTVHTGRAANGQLQAAEELLHHADFVADFACAPEKIEFNTRHSFHFESQVVSPWKRNNVVHGRLFQVSPDWQAHPTVLFLHGWNAEMAYRTLFPYLARRLNRVGVNAMLFELPYHSQRKPCGRGEVRNFLSDDLLHIVHAAHQSLADARALIAWLHQQGCQNVGAWGISLGAWLTGMLTCVEPQLDFAVMLAPVVRMDRVIAELDFCRPIRRTLQGASMKLEPMNLINRQPLLKPEDILLVASEHDLFAPIATIQELQEQWGGPELWRPRHGHISIMMAAPVMERVVGWVALRTNSRHRIHPKSFRSAA